MLIFFSIFSCKAFRCSHVAKLAQGLMGKEILKHYFTHKILDFSILFFIIILAHTCVWCNFQYDYLNSTFKIFSSKKSLQFHYFLSFKKRDLTFKSNLIFILCIVAMKFGVCMCYFFNKKLAKLWKKNDVIKFFLDLLGAKQYSKKNSENKNFSFNCYNLTIYKESMVEFFFPTQWFW